jgi:ribosomal protein S18 acetylase RimI-like enzyme
MTRLGASLAAQLRSNDGTTTLRPASGKDAAFLQELFYEEKAAMFAPLGLPAAMLETMLEQQFRAQQHGYASLFPDAESLIVLRAGQPIGRMMIAPLGESTLHLVDIALAGASRGRGIGTDVLTALREAARGAGAKRLTLSVNVTNVAAARLYQRLGFQFLDAGPDPVASRDMTLAL